VLAGSLENVIKIPIKMYKIFMKNRKDKALRLALFL